MEIYEYNVEELMDKVSTEQLNHIKACALDALMTNLISILKNDTDGDLDIENMSFGEMKEYIYESARVHVARGILDTMKTLVSAIIIHETTGADLEELLNGAEGIQAINCNECNLRDECSASTEGCEKIGGVHYDRNGMDDSDAKPGEEN